MPALPESSTYKLCMRSLDEVEVAPAFVSPKHLYRSHQEYRHNSCSHHDRLHPPGARDLPLRAHRRHPQQRAARAGLPLRLLHLRPAWRDPQRAPVQPVVFGRLLRGQQDPHLPLQDPRGPRHHQGPLPAAGRRHPVRPSPRPDDLPLRRRHRRLPCRHQPLPRRIRGLRVHRLLPREERQARQLRAPRLAKGDEAVQQEHRQGRHAQVRPHRRQGGPARRDLEDLRHPGQHRPELVVRGAGRTECAERRCKPSIAKQRRFTHSCPIHSRPVGPSSLLPFRGRGWCRLFFSGCCCAADPCAIFSKLYTRLEERSWWPLLQVTYVSTTALLFAGLLFGGFVQPRMLGEGSNERSSGAALYGCGRAVYATEERRCTIIFWPLSADVMMTTDR